MARIRTIKPDFWTDERLTECSLSARLLFIGTWNFADDKGNLPRSSKKIKMQVFPADNVECEALVIELLTQGLLIEYSVSGEKYLHIKNFDRHQVINRPSKSTIPDISLSDDSVSTHGEIIEGKEGKGREGIKEAKASMSGKPDDATPKPEKVQTKPQAIEVLEFLNAKANRNYRPTDVNLSLIQARLKEGYTPQDCKQVIAKKCREWSGDDKMCEYLRPATLFNREKFNQYIGEIVEVE